MSTSDIPNYATELSHPQHEEELDSTQSEFEDMQDSDEDTFGHGTIAFQSSNTDTFPMLSLNNINGGATNSIVPQGTFHIPNSAININHQSANNDPNQTRLAMAAMNKVLSPNTNNISNENHLPFHRAGNNFQNHPANNKISSPELRVFKNRASSSKPKKSNVNRGDVTSNIQTTATSATTGGDANETIEQLDDTSSHLINPNTYNTASISDLGQQKRRELTAEERNYIYGINDGTMLLQQKCEIMHKKFELLLLNHKKLRMLKKSDIAELLKALKPPRLSGTDLAQVSGFKYETYKTTLRRRNFRTNGHTVKRSGRKRKEEKENEMVNDRK